MQDEGISNDDFMQLLNSLDASSTMDVNQEQQRQQYLQQQRQQQEMMQRQQYQQEMERQQMMQRQQQQQQQQQQQKKQTEANNNSNNNNNVNNENLQQIRSSQLLEQISQLQKQQKEQLDNIRVNQKHLMCQPQKEAFELISSQHAQLNGQLVAEIKALQQLHENVIMPPAETYRLQVLLQELTLQQTQLELYQQELQQLTMAQPNRCIVALVPIEHPFPKVITKKKRMDDDPVVVQLLCGANVHIQSFSKMKAMMIYESHTTKQNIQQNIEADTQPIDAYRRLAKWHFKFLNGTRKNPVALRFFMQVQVTQGNSNATVTVESSPCGPFIVITNECQWEESEGTLIKKDAFGDQLEIHWPRFANILQKHFLRGTRQDPVRPVRCISSKDFAYIHAKFFGSQAMITPNSFDSFWTWFGKTMQKIRYQRHVLPLWQNGLIHGFLSRETVHNLLKEREVGTFLIRFSERNPGLFAIGYRVEDNDPALRVRHYLIKPDDTAGAKKTLPDFIAEQSAFVYLLQITNQTDSDGNLIYRAFQKAMVLESYYSKRSTLPPINGYDEKPVANSAAPNSFSEATRNAE